MSFPKYQEYSSTGLPWVGAIPSHWDLKPLKVLTQCLDGKRIPLNSEERSYKKGDVPYWGANAVMDYVDESLFDDDLVLIGEDGAPFLDPLKPVAFFSTGPIWPNNHIHVLKPIERVWAEFIVRSLNATDYATFIEGATRQKLTQTRLMNIPICWPDEAERAAICSFLDHETAKIDALIDEQKRLIELLKEKRQAVISHAVTKGLDPDVPMKDSGVEWLGEVPAHWSVLPLRYISTLIDGDRSSAYPSESDLVDEGIPFVSSKNIVGYKFTAKKLNFITLEKFKSLSRGKLHDGDLVITVRGTVGHVAVFDSVIMGRDTGFINAQMMIIRPNAGFTQYLRLCSESDFWQKQLDVAAYGSTVKQLSNRIVGGLIIALPPSEELSSLTAKVGGFETEFETLISEALKATKLLGERRSALISAAVTGKIDLRGWQSPVVANAPRQFDCGGTF